MTDTYSVCYYRSREDSDLGNRDYLVAECSNPFQALRIGLDAIVPPPFKADRRRGRFIIRSEPTSYRPEDCKLDLIHRWAELNGFNSKLFLSTKIWRLTHETGPSFTMKQLEAGRMIGKRDYSYSGLSLFDHVIWLKRGRIPGCILTQPYPHHIHEEICFDGERY